MTVETIVMRRAVSTPVLMGSISAPAAGVSQTTGPVTGTMTVGTSVMKMWLVLVLPLVRHHIFLFAYLISCCFFWGGGRGAWTVWLLFIVCVQLLLFFYCIFCGHHFLSIFKNLHFIPNFCFIWSTVCNLDLIILDSTSYTLCKIQSQ